MESSSHQQKWVHCLFLEIILFQNREHDKFVAYFWNQRIYQFLGDRLIYLQQELGLSNNTTFLI